MDYLTLGPESVFGKEKKKLNLCHWSICPSVGGSEKAGHENCVTEAIVFTAKERQGERESHLNKMSVFFAFSALSSWAKEEH